MKAYVKLCNGGEERKPQIIGKNKDKTPSVWLASRPLIYDVESRLFSGVRADRKYAELSLWGSVSKLMG